MSEDDSAFGQIIRRNRDSHVIAKHDTDAVTPELTGEMRLHFRPCVGLDQEVSPRKHLFDHTFNLDQVIGSQTVSLHGCEA